MQIIVANIEKIGIIQKLGTDRIIVANVEKIEIIQKLVDDNNKESLIER